MSSQASAVVAGKSITTTSESTKTSICPTQTVSTTSRPASAPSTSASGCVTVSQIPKNDSIRQELKDLWDLYWYYIQEISRYQPICDWNSPRLLKLQKEACEVSDVIDYLEKKP
jgi:hypothetical protein